MAKQLTKRQQRVVETLMSDKERFLHTITDGKGEAQMVWLSALRGKLVQVKPGEFKEIDSAVAIETFESLLRRKLIKKVRRSPKLFRGAIYALTDEGELAGARAS